MIPFNKPYLVGKELEYIKNSHNYGQLAGDGIYTKKCSDLLKKNTGCELALLTNSCTAALEMSAILLDIKEGDEVIMPSFTFVSTANAFVLRGAVPVFVDISPYNMNIDINLIERYITPRTKAIVPVHYAGVACEMENIMQIAKNYDLKVIEDAAQGIESYYKGEHLGSIGDIGCFSFHETKNIICGEGGALIINNPIYKERAEIIREKGTNRSQFIRGFSDKYTWVDLGSSFLPGEITAAFLYSQMEKAKEITKSRMKIWKFYKEKLEDLQNEGLITTPNISENCSHNGHIFYIIHKNNYQRDLFIKKMREKGVMCVFHYIPLHNSPFALRNLDKEKKFKLPITEDISSRLSRLPIWIGLDKEYVFEKAKESILEINSY